MTSSGSVRDVLPSRSFALGPRDLPAERADLRKNGRRCARFPVLTRGAQERHGGDRHHRKLRASNGIGAELSAPSAAAISGDRIYRSSSSPKLTSQSVDS